MGHSDVRTIAISLLLTQSVFRNLNAVVHMLVEDQATRRLSREVFCFTALAMLASPTT